MRLLIIAEMGGLLGALLILMALYTLVRWWRSIFGWMIFGLAASLAALVAASLAGAVDPFYPGRLLTFALLIAVLTGVVGWHIVALVRSQITRGGWPPRGPGTD